MIRILVVFPSEYVDARLPRLRCLLVDLCLDDPYPLSDLVLLLDHLVVLAPEVLLVLLVQVVGRRLHSLGPIKMKDNRLDFGEELAVVLELVLDVLLQNLVVQGEDDVGFEDLYGLDDALLNIGSEGVVRSVGPEAVDEHATRKHLRERGADHVVLEIFVSRLLIGLPKNFLVGRLIWLTVIVNHAVVFELFEVSFYLEEASLAKFLNLSVK